VAEELQLGQVVILEIPIPKGQRVTIAARTARRLGTEYGFQFLTLSVEQRVLLQHVMKGKPLPIPPSVSLKPPNNS